MEQSDKQKWFDSLKVGDSIEAVFKLKMFYKFKIYKRTEDCIWYSDEQGTYGGSCDKKNLHIIRPFVELN